MEKLRVLQRWVVLLACAILLPPPLAAQTASEKALLQQARQSYYSLRALGLESFACSIRPNWDLMLKEERKKDARSTETALTKLNQLHFNVTMAADGTVKLTHNELSGESREMNEALEEIFGGMEQLTSGFFETWKLFALEPPFPALDSKYEIHSSGPLYRLVYRENDADVTNVMTKDFAITDLSVTTPELVSSIRPRFAKMPEGWLLNAYQASYRSAKPEEATELKVTIGYQRVSGLQLVQKLNASGTYGSSPFEIELTFFDCQPIKRQ